MTSYWAGYLEGVESCHFPILNRQENGNLSHTDVIQRTLPIGMKLEGFSRAHNVTTRDMIFLAWALVLQSYTNSNEVCFGYIQSVRDIEGVGEITGPLVNVLPFRMSVMTDTTISRALQEIHAASLASLPHQKCLLSDIHRIVDVTDGSLFNTLVDVQWGHASRERSAMIVQTVNKEIPEYDLKLSAWIEGEETNMQLQYKTTLVSSQQATSVLATLETVLNSLMEDDQSALTSVGLCSDHDKALVWGWNELTPNGVEMCVHHLIAQSCAKQPDAPAICAWDGNLTYHQLDEISSRLAGHLQGRGVGPGIVVPLCFEKSRWTPVAMLAVIKTGAAFMLLDISHPLPRLKGLCDEVDCSVIVSGVDQMDLSTQLAADVIAFGDNQQPGEASYAEPTVEPGSPLYIIYTSGSTGKPKGIVIAHKAYSTEATALIKTGFLNCSARVAQFSSYAFDVSIMDHLTTLIAGACVCIPSETKLRDNMVEAINSLHASHAVLIPSISRLFPPHCKTSLVTLALAGESMTQTDLTRWVDRVRLFNMYGPAECCVIASIQTSFTANSDPRNIGHPCACVGWVVNALDVNQLMPLGAVGELLIEGPIVAQGYFKAPEKTAEAFIEPPPWLMNLRSKDAPSTPVYRTGDLVRMNWDGTLHYVGRRDTQVKLRGQRLELGEVEEKVRQSFDGLEDAVADVLTLPGARNQQLIAFVRGPGLGKIGSDLLATPMPSFYSRVSKAEARLRQEVPGFLVPSIFIPLTRIPRTASGKVYREGLRRALFAISPHALRRYTSPTEISKECPSTDAERHLQQVWAEVLHLPREVIGVNDHFFHLGGDSIDAMKAAALSLTGEVSVGVADIFAHPILRDLAAAAALVVQVPTQSGQAFSLASEEDAPALISTLSSQGLLPLGSQVVDLLPVTRMQRWFIDRDSLHYHNFHVHGPLDVGRLQAACNAMMTRYSTLRTVFFRRNGRLNQAILQNVPLPFVRYTTEQDLLPWAESLWREDRARFNLYDGLPVRFFLVSSSDLEHHVFSIRLSHTQYDGVSMPLLFRDLAATYNSNDVALPPTLAFADVIYQRASQPADTAFQFWREYLDGASMTIPFPAKNALEVQQKNHETLRHTQRISLPPICPGITMATLVKAAWGLCLANLKSSTDLTFGHTVNGRNMPLTHIDRALGPCLNYLPVRINLKRTWTVQDFLYHVQEQYVRTLQYDYLELRDIIRHCTDWPPETDFGCIVHHQNIQLVHELPLHDLLAVNYSVFTRLGLHKEILLVTEPYEDHMSIEVRANTQILSPEAGRQMARSLCEMIQTLAYSPDMLLAERLNF
ncbi:nonribosomal peptide synthase [Aspergillus pseudoviridinutans]|uniref:Nonribosomal peptide synthase n=1 Tax=Aspergillus pseudoviridinutans TaxID=1517512 RepID=A0A9P3BAY4_9EURO|nr:nonribosomal peptide synthase [Aspergillus pseudoviridinutans]GIJ86599.1 nonribosomal peptide synthase [Aspergillus pseudoviridinutans]